MFRKILDDDDDDYPQFLGYADWAWPETGEPEVEDEENPDTCGCASAAPDGFLFALLLSQLMLRRSE